MATLSVSYTHYSHKIVVNPNELGVSLLKWVLCHTVCVSQVPLLAKFMTFVYPSINLVFLYSVLAILYVSYTHYSQTWFIRTTWCLSTLYWPYCMCLPSTTLRPRLSEQLGVSLLCTGHTVCVSHPLHSDLVYPNNLVFLYSVLAILYVSYTHYSQTWFIRTTWCLSTLYWPYCMCLPSTTLRPRLSEQLGVSLLCTDHTVCVSHPLHSDLLYPNNLVSLYSVLTILYVSPIHYTQTSFIRTTWCLSTLYWPYCMCLPSTTLRPPLSEQLGVSLLCTGHTVCVSHPLHSDLVYPNNLVSFYSVLTILYVSHIHYSQTSFIRTTCVSLLCTGHTVCVSHRLQSDLIYPNNSVSFYSVLAILYVSHIHYSQTSFIQTTWCLSTLYWPYCMCLTSTTLRPRLSEQLGVSLLCTGHTVCVSHPLQSDLVYPNNLVSLYSVLAILYVSHIHYSQTSFIRTTWCLSTLYWPYCMCLTSTTVRPRLSEQLGVSLLCTDHTVCVSHPLQSDLVYPNNLVSLYSVLAILYVSHIHYSQTSFIRTTWCLSTLYWPYCMCLTPTSQTSFIRTTWCLSTLYWPHCLCLTPTTVIPRLSEELGVSLLCTGHTVCVSHPLHSDLVYPNNLVFLYSVLAILYVSYTHYSQTWFIRTTWCLSTLYWPYCMCLPSTTLRPRLSEQLGVSLLCTGHTVCVSHPLHSDLVYPNNLVFLYSVLAILYVSYTHYSQTWFIRTTWCLSTLYWPYCMCLPSTTLRPRLSEQLGVSLLCTDHTVCVSHPLHSDLVYPNNLVSLYPVLTILYVSPIHYTQTSFIRTTWCLSTLYWPYCMCLPSTTLRPPLSEQLGVSLLCTDHTVCVSHPLHSDLVYPNNFFFFFYFFFFIRLITLGI